MFTKRRNKKFSWLPNEDDEKWMIVVDATTGFSMEKLKCYFEKPTLAFLILWFCFSSGKEVIEKEFKKLGKKELEEMLDIAHTLGHDALAALIFEREEQNNMFVDVLCNYVE